MTNSCSNVDFPDYIKTESVFFDKQKKERSPFEVNLCCFGKQTTCNRAFFILALHYLIIFVVVLFSIVYLALRLQTSYHSGVLALLSACIAQRTTAKGIKKHKLRRHPSRQFERLWRRTELKHIAV